MKSDRETGQQPNLDECLQLIIAATPDNATEIVKGHPGVRFRTNAVFTLMGKPAYSITISQKGIVRVGMGYMDELGWPTQATIQAPLGDTSGIVTEEAVGGGERYLQLLRIMASLKVNWQDETPYVTTTYWDGDVEQAVRENAALLM